MKRGLLCQATVKARVPDHTPARTDVSSPGTANQILRLNLDATRCHRAHVSLNQRRRKSVSYETASSTEVPWVHLVNAIFKFLRKSSHRKINSGTDDSNSFSGRPGFSTTVVFAIVEGMVMCGKSAPSHNQCLVFVRKGLHHSKKDPSHAVCKSTPRAASLLLCTCVIAEYGVGHSIFLLISDRVIISCSRQKRGWEWESKDRRCKAES